MYKPIAGLIVATILVEPNSALAQQQVLEEVFVSARKVEETSQTVPISMSVLTEEKIQSIKDLLQMHSGNHNLKFVVYDDEEELKLEMNSRLQKIKISQELLEELKAQEVFYKLN